MIRPTPEQRALLHPIERFWFDVADWVLRHATPLCVAWNRLFMVHFSWFLTGPRVHVHGQAHLDMLQPGDDFVIVSNHRSFFDFYVIGPVLYNRSRLSKRILFPVRAPFFYDHPLGGVLNAIMSGFFMFPPILRDPQRRAFNRFALDRMIGEFGRKGQLIGMHPEGTRNKGDDPYVFLRTQPGVGQLLLGAPKVRALPVFITGLSNSMATEIRRTWTIPRAVHPIDVVIGPPVDVEDIRAQGTRLALQMGAAQRCMDAVAALGTEHRTRIRPIAEE